MIGFYRDETDTGERYISPHKCDSGLYNWVIAYALETALKHELDKHKNIYLYANKIQLFTMYRRVLRIV